MMQDCIFKQNTLEILIAIKTYFGWILFSCNNHKLKELQFYMFRIKFAIVKISEVYDQEFFF